MFPVVRVVMLVVGVAAAAVVVGHTSGTEGKEREGQRGAGARAWRRQGRLVVRVGHKKKNARSLAPSPP